jgi:hypothetical protein
VTSVHRKSVVVLDADDLALLLVWGRYVRDQGPCEWFPGDDNNALYDHLERYLKKARR